MNKIFIICFFIFFDLNTNIFLQRPQILSEQDINSLAQNWETQFTWRFSKGCSFTCSYEQEKAGFLFKLFGLPIRSCNFISIQNIKKSIENNKQKEYNYYFEKPLKFDNPSPKKIIFDDLCNLLKDKKFIFYTGAGVSSGNVQTMSDLKKLLKLGCGKKAFLKEIFFYSESITKAFSDFCESAIYGIPTKAHLALHRIAQFKNICILTENVDLLQQRTGSNPLFVRSNIVYSAQEKDFQEIDLIICIGLSHDDCGFIAHYKKNNPNGIIVAIDLSNPNYLSECDFIIQEDIQKILPKLEQIILDIAESNA